jgi:two-component system cell cycle response regulator
MRQVKILLLDDSEDDYKLLQILLRDPHVKYTILWTNTVAKALDLIKREHFDCTLVDNALHKGETGFDLLLHPEYRESKIPALFIAGQGDEYVAVKAIKSGAYDYLVKGRFDTSRLMYAIDEAIKDLEYRLKIEANHIELIKLATTDELTGLFNRRHFMTKLQEEISRYARYRTPLSIALLDIDYFKKINDEYGHDAGDFVLREMGKLMRSCVRSTDSACRYGGEEFILVFPSTDLRSTEIFAERIRAHISKHNFYYDYNYIPVTVSIGLAEAYAEITNPDLLLKLADKALYAAKKDGRNRVISYRYGSGL